MYRERGSVDILDPDWCSGRYCRYLTCPPSSSMPGDSNGTLISRFIQYFARNWPWYSLRGLHIRITWFPLYGIRIPLFSLYGIHVPLLPYMVIQPIVLGMALLWVAMDSSLSQGPLLWHHNDMTVIVPRNTRGREQDSLLDSLRFVTHFWEITPYILRDAIVVLVQSQCYSINARAFGPRTPYRVGGLAGNVMHA